MGGEKSKAMKKMNMNHVTGVAQIKTKKDKTALCSFINTMEPKPLYRCMATDSSMDTPYWSTNPDEFGGYGRRLNDALPGAYIEGGELYVSKAFEIEALEAELKAPH